MAYAILFGMISLVILAVSVVLMVKTCAHLRVGVQRGRNNDRAATERFLDLVKEMKNDMVIHDDGTNTSTTLYNDERVLSALKSRIDAGAKVRCLFNEQEEIKISGLDNIEVYYLPDDATWQSEVHFKIIDSGKKAYLSRHRDGGEREYQIIDCTRARRTGKRLFADLIQEFEQGVEVARQTVSKNKSGAHAPA